ncbi:MAG: hypothetical protein RL621_1836 [Bacteroidota bacterium]|jgi:hypothetical protein
MKRTWYQTAKECTALRKNTLRVDLAVFVDDEKSFTSQNVLMSTVKSFLTAAIIKGIDVIGVLSALNPNVGWIAWQMALDQQMDIAVLPGQVYKCSTGEVLYIYKIRETMKPGLDLPKACAFAHKLGGYVVATGLTKKKVAQLDKLQGSAFAPDGVEIYNQKNGGYRDLNIDFPKFITSASTSANDLEQSNAFSLIERKEAEKIGLLAPNQGVDFEPKYLKSKSGVPNA